MKFKITILLITFLLSCSNKKEDKFLSKFESVLGKENSELLDFLVDDFENYFLKNQYPHLNTENAYKQCLDDVKNGKTENWKSVSQNAIDKFNASKLRLEKYQFPDSVWVIKNRTFDKIESDSLMLLDINQPYLKARFKDLNPDGSFEYSYERNYEYSASEADFESAIKQQLNTPKFHSTGKYMQALMSIQDKGKLHKKLFETLESTVHIAPSMIASIFLDCEIDLNDELNRKLIVLELFY